MSIQPLVGQSERHAKHSEASAQIVQSITLQNMHTKVSYGMIPLFTRVPLEDIKQILHRIFTSRLLISWNMPSQQHTVFIMVHFMNRK